MKKKLTDSKKYLKRKIKKIECAACGKKFPEETKTIIFNYILCDDCSLLAEMSFEGFLQNRMHSFNRKLSRKDSFKSFKKLEPKEKIKEGKCRGCSLSFVDPMTKKISCVDDLDLNNCVKK